MARIRWPLCERGWHREEPCPSTRCVNSAARQAQHRSGGRPMPGLVAIGLSANNLNRLVDYITSWDKRLPGLEFIRSCRRSHEARSWEGSGGRSAIGNQLLAVASRARRWRPRTEGGPRSDPWSFGSRTVYMKTEPQKTYLALTASERVGDSGGPGRSVAFRKVIQALMMPMPPITITIPPRQCHSHWLLSIPSRETCQTADRRIAADSNGLILGSSGRDSQIGQLTPILAVQSRPHRPRLMLFRPMWAPTRHNWDRMTSTRYDMEPQG
jgi:hypothetical protein